MRAIYLPKRDEDDGSQPPSPSSLLYSSTYPTPTPTSSQYLIQIHATCPNPLELPFLTSLNENNTGSKIPSHEICGTVVSTPSSDMNRSPDGPKFKIGDEVFGLLALERDGGAADYAVAVEGELGFKPRNVTAADAAGVPLAGLMAWQALEGAGLRSSLIDEAVEGGGCDNGGGDGVGECIRVLVMGAESSEVGRYILQLLRAGSAPFDGGIRRKMKRVSGGREDRRDVFWICATCSSSGEGEDEDGSGVRLLRDELGVDAVVTLDDDDDQKGDAICRKLSQTFTERGWEPVDVVLDCEDNEPRSPDTAVSLASSPDIVRRDGGWEVLKLNQPEWCVEMVDVVDKSNKSKGAKSGSKDAVGTRNRSWSFTVQPDGVQLEGIAEVVEEGEIRPVVERVFGLYEAKEAMEMVDEGVKEGGKRFKGKVVLRVNT